MAWPLQGAFLHALAPALPTLFLQGAPPFLILYPSFFRESLSLFLFVSFTCRSPKEGGVLQVTPFGERTLRRCSSGSVEKMGSRYR